MPSVRGPLKAYYFTFFAALAAYLPYLPSWLREHGIHGLGMSVLMALLPAMNVLGPPGFGLLADSFGLRGRLLRIASFGAAAWFSLLVVHSLWSQQLSYWVVFVAYLGFAFFRTPMQLMADVVALEQGSDFARLRLWGSLGFMLAVPLLGRYMNLQALWHLPVVVGLLLWCSHLTTWAMPSQRQVPRRAVFEDLRRIGRGRAFRTFLVAAMLGQGAHVGYDIVVSMHFLDLGLSGTWVGVAWAIATASEIAVMAYSPRLLRMLPAARWLLIALLFQALRWALLAWLSNPWLLVALQPLHALSFGLRWVSTMWIIGQFASQSSASASVQGLHLTAHSLGSVLGMLTFGWLYEAHGGASVFLVSAVVALLAAGFALPQPPEARLSHDPVT